MKLIKIFSLTLALLFSNSFWQDAEDGKKVKILLIGDSTTIGGKGIFETGIEKIINKNTETPSVEVINSARGGETALSVVESGRYDKDIKPLGDTIDYIFVRYGINDYIKTKPFEGNFQKHYKDLIAKLRADFPSAKIILATIIPFFKKDEQHDLVNGLIKKVAKEEKLDVFDVYKPYKKGLETFGENAMSVRFIPFEDIPEKYRDFVKPYTSYVQWKKTDMVRVLTTELDPIFHNVEGWYKDRHPNPMGYHLLALETVNYILPKLERNHSDLPLSKWKEKEGVETYSDQIYQLTAPKEIKVGKKIIVSVSYEASQKRDVRVFVQLNEAPWTTFFAAGKKVNTGSGTLEFEVIVPENTPLGSNYKIGANLLPEGKPWPDRLDDRILSNVTLSK